MSDIIDLLNICKLGQKTVKRYMPLSYRINPAEQELGAAFKRWIKQGCELTEQKKLWVYDPSANYFARL